MAKNHRLGLLGLSLVLLLATSAARAQGSGLSAPAEVASLSRWQARVMLGGQVPVWHGVGARDDARPFESLSIAGDYYFHRLSGPASTTGGFRATSAVIVGNRTTLWAELPGSSLSSGMFSVGRRLFGASGSASTPVAVSDSVALPYLGLGYTGNAARSGWGFNADLGLVALSPGQAIKLGRVVGGVQNLDEVVRDMRLAPVLQLGVSYSF